jgi:hypothetical protein
MLKLQKVAFLINRATFFVFSGLTYCKKYTKYIMKI